MCAHHTLDSRLYGYAQIMKITWVFSEHQYLFIMVVYTPVQCKPWKHEFLIKKTRLLIPKTTCNTSFLHPNIEEQAVVLPHFIWAYIWKFCWTLEKGFWQHTSAKFSFCFCPALNLLVKILSLYCILFLYMALMTQVFFPYKTLCKILPWHILCISTENEQTIHLRTF